MASRRTVRAASLQRSLSTTADTIGASIGLVPGVHQIWLSTRADPRQLPGRAAKVGRKKLCEPRGQIQSAIVVITSPDWSRKYTFTLAAVVPEWFCTWISVSQPCIWL